MVSYLSTYVFYFRYILFLQHQNVIELNVINPESHKNVQYPRRPPPCPDLLRLLWIPGGRGGDGKLCCLPLQVKFICKFRGKRPILTAFSGHMRSTGQKAVLPMLLAAQSLDSADPG